MAGPEKAAGAGGTLQLHPAQADEAKATIADTATTHSAHLRIFITGRSFPAFIKREPLVDDHVAFDRDTETYPTHLALLSKKPRSETNASAT